MGKDIYTKYAKDDAGNIIDPPIIPDMERQLIEAQAGGDTASIQVLTDDYAERRAKVADRHNQNVDNRADEDRRLLAERDQRRRQENEDAAAVAQQQRERAELDRLREEDADRASQPVPDPNTVSDPAPGPDAPAPSAAAAFGPRPSGIAGFGGGERS